MRRNRFALKRVKRYTWTMALAPDIEIAKQFAETLHHEFSGTLVRVSLFGSRARRDHEIGSDFDLLIVLREPTGHDRSRIHLQAQSWELERQVDLSTKILSEVDFCRLRPSSEPFWRAFERDEQVLWPTH
jgi:predicted nucleotidyltransferase